jgi:hypothetical protein
MPFVKPESAQRYTLKHSGYFKKNGKPRLLKGLKQKTQGRMTLRFNEIL